jgi:hypothetical protein
MDSPDITLPPWLLALLISFGALALRLFENILGNLLTPKVEDIRRDFSTKFNVQRVRYGGRFFIFRTKRLLSSLRKDIARYSMYSKLAESRDALIEYLATTFIFLFWNLFQVLFFSVLWLITLASNTEVTFSNQLIAEVIGWLKVITLTVAIGGSLYTFMNALSACKETWTTLSRVSLLRRFPEQLDENNKLVADLKSYEVGFIEHIKQTDDLLSGQVDETDNSTRNNRTE